jgi:mRNA interferase RelE/StbE
VTSEPRYEVAWTETAVRMLSRIGDRRIQQQLFDVSKRLELEPEKQGKPLREALMGFRSLRAVGQRYRILYTLDRPSRIVYVVAAGLRRAGVGDDVYALAQKLVRLGLAPSAGARRKPRRPRRKKG